MERKYRLKLNSDFRLVRREGKVWVHPLLVLYVGRNQLPVSRFGFSVSKRIGKAVARNRVRRRIREAVRLRLPSIPSGWDVVFVARPAIVAASYSDIAATVETLMKRAGLLEAIECESNQKGESSQS